MSRTKVEVLEQDACTPGLVAADEILCNTTIASTQAQARLAEQLGSYSLR